MVWWGACRRGNVLTQGFRVPAEMGRHDEKGLMIWGLIPLSIKVSTSDSGGRMFAFEHRNMSKGGPPRHVHHEQDEWFYVTRGQFAFEIGEERFRLGPGDSLFAPRKIPHAWACIDPDRGTILTILSPAGTFETFIRDTTKYATLPTPDEIAAAFSAHGMTVVGPPLKVD